MDGRTTVGNIEYQDVLGAWDWLITNKGFSPAVGLFGESLGGATALFAFVAETRTAALFLESTYADLEQMIAEDLKNQGFPAFLASSAYPMGRVLSGQNLLADDPVAIIQQVGTSAHLRRPQPRGYAGADRPGPRARRGSVCGAGDNVTAWFTDHGEHVQTPAVYPDEFEQRLVGFFRQNGANRDTGGCMFVKLREPVNGLMHLGAAIVAGIGPVALLVIGRDSLPKQASSRSTARP